MSSRMSDEQSQVSKRSQTAKAHAPAQDTDGHIIVEKVISDSMGWAQTKDKERLFDIMAHDAIGRECSTGGCCHGRG